MNLKPLAAQRAEPEPSRSAGDNRLAERRPATSLAFRKNKGLRILHRASPGAERRPVPDCRDTSRVAPAHRSACRVDDARKFDDQRNVSRRVV